MCVVMGSQGRLCRHQEKQNKWFGLVQHVIQPFAQELGFCYQGVCTFYATYMPSVMKVSRAFAAAIDCLKSIRMCDPLLSSWNSHLDC